MLGPGKPVRRETRVGAPISLKLWRESQQLPEGEKETKDGVLLRAWACTAAAREKPILAKPKRSGRFQMKPLADGRRGELASHSWLWFGLVVLSHPRSTEGGMSEGPSSFRLRLQKPTPISPGVLAPVCPDPTPAWHLATLALAAGLSERPAWSWPWGRTSRLGSAEQEARLGRLGESHAVLSSGPASRTQGRLIRINP